MKKIIIITILSMAGLAAILVVSSFTKNPSSCQELKEASILIDQKNQPINLFVSHGHCSLPFGATVENLIISAPEREDLGNPLEGLELSFEIDPNSFNVCSDDDLTTRLKTPGLFISEKNEKITFKSSDVYSMGVDWYQVNGRVSIKGLENDVKFFLSEIREPQESKPSSLILEGQLNLFDWGIDYDQIVTGKSNSHSTKWMHLNMKIKVS